MITENKNFKKEPNIPQDIIIQLHKSGHWIIYNVFTQDSLAVTTSTLNVLSLLNKGNTVTEIAKQYEKEEFLIWEISKFSHLSSPLADPSRMIRDYENWPFPSKLNLFDLIKLLELKRIIVLDEAQYQLLFALKNSFLDKKHLGNFHQQIGQKLIFEQKIDPSDWWVKQKFNSDYTELNNTLYKAIQGNFLNSFFNSRFNSSSKVIDIGCGVGYYTKLMGKTGAEVLGIDPNERYINIANKDVKNNVSFKYSKIGGKEDLDWIPSQSADFIFMSDALSFYFVPPSYITSDTIQKPDINILFSDIKRILKPGGSFISVEPNGLFLFRPWFGEIQRPFTIITEYNNPWYNIVQNYSQAIKAFITGGFIIKDMKDVSVDEEYAKTDIRGTNFAKEFPLWCYFELQPSPPELDRHNL